MLHLCHQFRFHLYNPLCSHQLLPYLLPKHRFSCCAISLFFLSAIEKLWNKFYNCTTCFRNILPQVVFHFLSNFMIQDNSFSCNPINFNCSSLNVSWLRPKPFQWLREESVDWSVLKRMKWLRCSCAQVPQVSKYWIFR